MGLYPNPSQMVYKFPTFIPIRTVQSVRLRTCATVAHTQLSVYNHLAVSCARVTRHQDRTMQ